MRTSGAYLSAQTLVVMAGTVPLELAAFGAAKLGLVDELETCLSQGAPVNATDAEGEIAFQPSRFGRQIDGPPSSFQETC